MLCYVLFILSDEMLPCLHANEIVNDAKDIQNETLVISMIASEDNHISWK